ncbi:hypothetical protein Tco_0434579 [Tanacetum coccineum]
MTWGWRNVLKLCPLIREFIWKKIGNGSTTSVWFDRWCIQSPLADLISSRDIFQEGFNKETKVCDLVKNGVLDWPTSWLSKYPSLNAIDSPILAPNSHDLLEWRNEDGLGCSFLAHTVWNTIRTKGSKVRWYDAVWFSCCIPRHAVYLWLVIHRRLKTQDLLRHWDNVNYLHVTCSLCESQHDSHEHLFFECSFSQQVWNQVKGVAGLASSNASIYDTIDDIIPFAARKTSKSVIAKLVVAATSYFIWQERNGRLFKNKKRTVNQVVDCIMNTVRLKLMSCRLKKSRSACDIVKAWNLVVSVCSYADFGLYFDAGIGFYYDSGLINLSCGHVSGLNTGFWKCNTIYIIDKGSRLEWLKDFSSDLVRILGSLNFQVLNFKDFMVSNQVWAG